MKLSHKISILLWAFAIAWFVYWVADGMPDHGRNAKNYARHQVKN